MHRRPKLRGFQIFLAVWLTACGTDKGQDQTCAQTTTSAASTATVVHPTAAQLKQGEALPGSYIVAFRLPPGGPGLKFASFADEHHSHFAYLSDTFAGDARVKNIRFLSSVDLRPATKSASALSMPPYLAQLNTDSLSPDALMGSLAQVDFASGEDAKSALGEWEQDGNLWFAEPNYVSKPSDDNLFKTYENTYSKLTDWWLTAINITQAYDAISARDQSSPDTQTDQTLAAAGPIVAILDSGVDYNHPALSAHIWKNTAENAEGCKNDTHGCNTTVADRGNLGNGDVWPFDADGPGQSCAGRDPNCSHGTHVAGLVSADATWADSAGQHAAGVCPICRLMILKIVSKVGKDSGILDSSILAAFKYVTLFRESGKYVRVINASFGKFVRSRAVGLLIRAMRDNTGTIVVAAAGNEDTLTQEFPAAFSDAIAVAAVNSEFKKVSFSNFGRWVSISAPGEELVSTIPGAEVEAKSGTSMASPMVAGVAGLLVARYPNISFETLRNSILLTADPALYGKDFAGGYNYNCYYPKIENEAIRQPLLGYGLLNAGAAVSMTTSQGLPLFNALDRVHAGCGIVQGISNAAPAAWTTLVVIMLPMLLLCRLYILQVRRAMSRKRLSSPRRSPVKRPS